MDILNLIKAEVIGMDSEKVKAFHTELISRIYLQRKEILKALKPGEEGETAEEKAAKINAKKFDKVVWVRKGKAGTGTETIPSARIVEAYFEDETIEGGKTVKVGKLVFRTPSNGFKVLTLSSIRVIPKPDAKPAKVRAATK